MADRGGYIGRNPGDSSVIVARQSFEPTGVQTDFTFSSGYTPGYIDVYLNGSRLIVASDYTATDGSVVGLTSFASNGDVLECVAYKAFNVGNVTNATGNFTVGGDLTVDGNATFNGTVTGISSVSYATTSFGLEGSPNIAVGDITATGDVSIGGTLTYEDVTNVDSVGIITARSGIKVTAGGVNVSAGGVYVNAGVSTFPQSTTITAKTGGQVLVGSSAEATIGSYTWNGLQVRSTTGGAAIVFEEFNTSNWMAGLKFGKSRASSIGSYTIVQNGDNLGNLIWHGADGTDMACQAASIQVEVDGAPGSNDMPGRIIFGTTADGAVAPTERLRISADGKAGFTGIVTALKFEGPTNVPAGQTGTVTLAASDAGKHVAATGTVTLGTGGGGASIFAVGDAVTIWNNSAGAITITLSAVTCYNAADATTGNRTLGARGLATILCVAANTYVISGSGLT